MEKDNSYPGILTLHSTSIFFPSVKANCSYLWEMRFSPKSADQSCKLVLTICRQRKLRGFIDLEIFDGPLQLGKE